MANALRINRVLLSYYESGSRQPPLNVVRALASLYGTSVTKLLEGSDVPKDPSHQGVLLRSLPQLQERAPAGWLLFLRYVTAYVQLLKDLGRTPPRKGQSPFPALHDRTARKDAARWAREVRNYLGLGAGAAGNLAGIIDEHMLVFRLPLGDLATAPSGFFYNHPEAGFCVVVNTETWPGRQTFTLAHETAHAFFHSQFADLVVSAEGAAPQHLEFFANGFAAELLVPIDGLARAIDRLGEWERLGDPSVIVHLQHMFGVSYELMLLRLRQETMISQERYEALKQISSTKLSKVLGYRSSDTMDSIDPLDALPSRMLRLVRFALDEDVISRTDAAETLGVSTEDIIRLDGKPRATKDEKDQIRSMESTFRP